MQEPVYEVVWPKSRRGLQGRRAAARLDGLAGRRVGFVWDYMFRGDEIFPLLEEGLGRQFPGVSFVSYDTFGSTHGDREREVLAEMPDKLRQLGVDAVISGMGC